MALPSWRGHSYIAAFLNLAIKRLTFMTKKVRIDYERFFITLYMIDTRPIKEKTIWLRNTKTVFPKPRMNCRINQLTVARVATLTTATKKTKNDLELFQDTRGTDA